MNEELLIIDDVETLMSWVRDSNSVPELTASEAKLLIDMTTAHGVELMTDSYFSLYSKEGSHDMIRISLDDLIDQACEWNYREIFELKQTKLDSYSFEEYARREDRLKQLKEIGKTLDTLFDQTVYGKRLSDRMRELAKETIDQVRLIPVVKIPSYDEKGFDPEPLLVSEPTESYHSDTDKEKVRTIDVTPGEEKSVDELIEEIKEGRVR